MFKTCSGFTLGSNPKRSSKLEPHSCGFYCTTNSGISGSLDFFIQVGSHRQTSLTKCPVFPGESFSACRPSGHVSSMQQLLIFQLLTLGTLWLQDAPPSRPGLLPISAPSTWRLLESENGLHHRTAGTVLSLGSQEGLYSLGIWGWQLGEEPEPVPLHVLQQQHLAIPGRSCSYSLDWGSAGPERTRGVSAEPGRPRPLPRSHAHNL